MAGSFVETISVSWCDVIHLIGVDISTVSDSSFTSRFVGPLRTG